VLGHLDRNSDRRALMLASRRAHSDTWVVPPVLAAILRAGQPQQAAEILRWHNAQLATEDRSAATHHQLRHVYGEVLQQCPDHILHAVDNVLAFHAAFSDRAIGRNMRSAYRELPLELIHHPQLTSALRLQIWQRMEST
jgi:hypothetical protein